MPDVSMLLILFVYIQPCYEYDLHTARLVVCVFPHAVCVCASRCSLQLSVYVFLLAACVRHCGTAPGFT